MLLDLVASEQRVGSRILFLPLLTLYAPVHITPVHITANIRKQLDRAEGLHQGVGCHRSDDDLCETLVNGGYHWTGVTPADIRLNRKLRGACPQCIQGKMKQRPTPDESISSPPASVGAKIWGDVERFTTKSVGGNLAALKFYDEFSGNCTVCALPNLTVVYFFL